jgi:hypothetical protein
MFFSKSVQVAYFVRVAKDPEFRSVQQAQSKRVAGSSSRKFVSRNEKSADWGALRRAFD